MSTAWVECWKCDVCSHRWIKGEIWPSHCAKCRSRKWNQSAGANNVEQAIKSQPPPHQASQTSAPGPAKTFGTPSVKVDRKVLQDICDGKGLGSIKYHNEPTDPMTIALASTPREMCPYKEWFEGEQYACGLPVHSAKVKHTHGHVLS